VVHAIGAVVERRAGGGVDDGADGSVDDDIASPATKRKLGGKAGVDPAVVDNG
jgi:hypothetical protein